MAHPCAHLPRITSSLLLPAAGFPLPSYGALFCTCQVTFLFLPSWIRRASNSARHMVDSYFSHLLQRNTYPKTYCFETTISRSFAVGWAALPHMVSAEALAQLEVPKWLHSCEWQLGLSGAGNSEWVGSWGLHSPLGSLHKGLSMWLLGFPHKLEEAFQKGAFQKYRRWRSLKAQP